MYTLHWHQSRGQWTTLFGSVQTGHETRLKQILFTIFLATNVQMFSETLRTGLCIALLESVVYHGTTLSEVQNASI
jgi:hypothetical protein